MGQIKSEMKGSVFFVALIACALAADDVPAPAGDKEAPQELLQTGSKSKFISPFVNPYMLNPLIYFGAGMATPFLLGGMMGGAATGTGQMGMGTPGMAGAMSLGQMGMPQKMGMPQMGMPQMMMQTGAKTGAEAKTGFYGGLGYPGMYGMPYGYGYGMPYGYGYGMPFGYGYG